MTVQAAPGEPVIFAVLKGFGLGNAPFDQGIPLHMVGAVFFGRPVQTPKLVSGKANALAQREIETVTMRQRPQMRT